MSPSILSADLSRLIETLRPHAAEVAAPVRGRAPVREEVLTLIGRDLAARVRTGGRVGLVFICTHNSRRSHLAQAWAIAAAEAYGLGSLIETHSGGTEATACNVRTVAALRRAGFQVVRSTEGANPRHLVQCSESVAPVAFWSKRFDDPSIPRRGFVAVMTCAAADADCPLVPGAAIRWSLPYEDPKVADGTEAEAATYDARSMEIGRDVFEVFRIAAEAAS